MVQKLPLSAIILTFNDEHLITPAIESLAGWVDEIHIVDSGSTDQTLSIAARYTDKIVTHPFENYAAQRNWAQDHLPLANEWVLHLDSDERITSELRQALHDFFSSDQPQSIYGLFAPRRTVFLGRWIRHGGHYPVYHMRIFRHAHGRCEDRLYDQHFVVAGPTQKIRGDIIDTITTSLESWTQRHVRWANLEVQQQQNPPPQQRHSVKEDLSGSPIEQRRWMKQSVYNRMPLFLRVFVYFFYRYFLRLGFLDGTQGLIFHFLQGFWFRFYIDARLWEMRHQSHPD